MERKTNLPTELERKTNLRKTNKKGIAVAAVQEMSLVDNF